MSFSDWLSIELVFICLVSKCGTLFNFDPVMYRYNQLDLDQTIDKIHIRSLLDVITKYQWLIDTYNVDYFVDNNWSKLPKSWANLLKKFDIKDIESFLSNELNQLNGCVLPLSLLSFRSTCFALQLSRKSSNSSKISLLGKQFSLNDKLLESELKNSDNSKMKYEILTRNMKHKKRHEIARLSHLVDQLLKCIPDCKTIIDCGSGQGHLSRILSLCLGYNVISIESNEHNVLGAQNKDTSTMASLKRYRLTDQIHSQLPKKVNQLLDNNSSISEVTENSVNYMLLGLHSCGPLSNVMIKQLTSCSDAKAMVLISCCYMKTDIKSFPMSQMVSNQWNHPNVLSYTSKEVACHAIDKFINKIKNNNNLDSLTVHCFRAILESLIVKFCPNMRHKSLKRVKITEDMTFEEYFHKAVNGLNISIPNEELDSEFVDKCLEHKKTVVIFYSLRLLIAPLIETLILLDFINYLKENGIKTAVLPLFDPILSPRNNVLIAIK